MIPNFEDPPPSRFHTPTTTPPSSSPEPLLISVSRPQNLDTSPLSPKNAHATSNSTNSSSSPPDVGRLTGLTHAPLGDHSAGWKWSVRGR
ncbi:hypothetical protein BJ508DRAFT_415487 [Ascobolus immersus RN42]|uniref:Uncharacterized protein n=1 Tax=Ascobolus immersus RN42 TaxID=1160509 RepID=A0A3N4I444_ASCIM|nr:hypothetical protein BJ508DRAFT_415487 [Ascobolus immersus RN42]